MPAPRLIHLFRVVRKPITTELLEDETSEKTSKGVPMPIPKARKLRILPKKLETEIVAWVSSTKIKAGLHGITNAPKKKPNKKALARGFFLRGTFARGKNPVKSTLKIISRLIRSRIPNAIGDIVWMTAVNDFFRSSVNVSPTNSIKTSTPLVTTKPIRARVLRLSDFPES